MIVKLDSCSHVLPGKITKFIPARKPDNYSYKDISALIISLTVLLVFPQFWLWKNKFFLIVFWSLFIMAVVEVRLFVCKNCKNAKCPFFPSK